MKVRWSERAIQDLDDLYEYIALDNIKAAKSIGEELLSAIDALARHPEIGRKGRLQGTRELVVSPHIVAYGVSGETIEILAIIHGARKWPGSL